MDHPKCYDRLVALHREGKAGSRRCWMTAEDTQARADAVKFADGHQPMVLEHTDPEIPPGAENPQPYVCGPDCNKLVTWEHTPENCWKPEVPKKRTRRTRAEIEADKAAKLVEREALKVQRAAEREAAKIARAEERVAAKAALKAQKLAEAEGGHVDLPAIVFRRTTGAQKRVVHASDTDAWAVIEMYLDDLCTDVENSGYPVGHELYELRTIQLGGEEAAVVFDGADPEQLKIVALALSMAKRLWSHSASVEAVAFAVAGLIGWDEMWGKLYDSVLKAKLIDPKMSGSDADALKELSADLLREYAVSPEAEKAKNALFKEMGCLVKTDLTTPKEKNGWFMVNKNSVVMTVYAGSDVLDLAAVLRILPDLPVDASVMEREREFEAMCATVAKDGFKLDWPHIRQKITDEEIAREAARANVVTLSDGKITNPKSPEVLQALPEIIPGLELPLHRKTKQPTADKGALEGLCLKYKDEPLAFHLFKQILAYRHHDTTLGLLLRPLDNLCENGDGRMRPTVYTIEASTGRTSCRRPNGQQFSRQGGVRACVTADEGYRGISADFEGCEIRVAAALSGDRALYEAEVSPMCYACHGNPCECGKGHTGLHWLAAHEAFGSGATKEHRYWCKRGIFCKLFGGGPDTAASQVYCDVSSMQSVFRAFEELAPTYKAWDDWLRDCYREGSMVWRDYNAGVNYSQPIEGRRRMIYRAYSGRNIYITNGEHAAGNGAIQGTARELLVDGTLLWKRTQWGKYPILPVHDQIISFVPEPEAAEATKVLAVCMETDVLSTDDWNVYIGADVDEPFVSWPDSS